MTDTQRLVISATPVKKITLELVGKEYLIRAPKASLGIVLAQRIQAAGDNVEDLLEEIKNWLVITFGSKQGPKVYDRIFDPDDELDIPHIVSLIEQLAEMVTGNPTT